MRYCWYRVFFFSLTTVLPLRAAASPVACHDGVMTISVAQVPDPDTRRVLLELCHQGKALGPDEWVSRKQINSALHLSDLATHEHLTFLQELGLATSSGRMSGGWRPTGAGRRLSADLHTSRTSGRERYEHTMRELLRLAVAKPRGDFTRDDWEAWDLHEPDLSPVTLAEREAAMDSLEQQDYLTSTHAWGARHVRSQVTAKGRMVLSRPDISVADAGFGEARTSVMNYDQRVGIRAETFTNQGAVQTGDHTVQQVIITNDQRQMLIQHLEHLRGILDDPALPRDVVEIVGQAVDDLEAVAAEDGTSPGRLHELREKALTAAVTAAGTEAGKRLLQSVVDLGGLITG